MTASAPTTPVSSNDLRQTIARHLPQSPYALVTGLMISAGEYADYTLLSLRTTTYLLAILTLSVVLGLLTAAWWVILALVILALLTVGFYFMHQRAVRTVAYLTTLPQQVAEGVTTEHTELLLRHLDQGLDVSLLTIDEARQGSCARIRSRAQAERAAKDLRAVHASMGESNRFLSYTDAIARLPAAATAIAAQAPVPHRLYHTFVLQSYLVWLGVVPLLLFIASHEASRQLWWPWIALLATPFVMMAPSCTIIAEYMRITEERRRAAVLAANVAAATAATDPGMAAEMLLVHELVRCDDAVLEKAS